MLSYEYLNDAVEFSNSKIPVLVIETRKFSGKPYARFG